VTITSYISFNGNFDAPPATTIVNATLDANMTSYTIPIEYAEYVIALLEFGGGNIRTVITNTVTSEILTSVNMYSS
jgi:hypothetical protein